MAHRLWLDYQLWWTIFAHTLLCLVLNRTRTVLLLILQWWHWAYLTLLLCWPSLATGPIKCNQSSSSSYRFDIQAPWVKDAGYLLRELDDAKRFTQTDCVSKNNFEFFIASVEPTNTTSVDTLIPVEPKKKLKKKDSKKKEKEAIQRAQSFSSEKPLLSSIKTLKDNAAEITA